MNIIQIISKSNRKIVIHETCYFSFDDIISQLQKNDLLFLDDCLYSQYVFLKEKNVFLKEKNIHCIIGFSNNIYRRSDRTPIYISKCSECHDRIHNNDFSAYDSYMNIDEIRDLLSFDNIHLAAHGFNHLDFQQLKMKTIDECKVFQNDIKMMNDKFKKMNLHTEIFVFPYSYDNILLAYPFLKKLGYRFFFAGSKSKRIPFENINNKNMIFE